MNRVKFQRFILCTCLLCLCFQSAICSAGAKQRLEIPQFRTVELPDQLMVINGNDIIKSMAKLSFYLSKKMGATALDEKKLQDELEGMDQYTREHGIGFYQLALKERASYNTALMFTAKFPSEGYADMMRMQWEIQCMDRPKQLEITAQIGKMINYNLNSLLRGKPEDFSVEIMEVYPVEYKVTERMKYTSVGGSVAVRLFKIISPYAFKLYLVQSEKGMHLIGFVSDGMQRDVWNKVVGKMLDSAQLTAPLVPN